MNRNGRECRRPCRTCYDFCPAGRSHWLRCVRARYTASGAVIRVSEQKVVVDAMVEGGKASGGPPIGPALGPTGVNVFAVVTKINEVTQVFVGLKVPVKIIVDTTTKQFEVEVGVPPTSALILKEAGAPKGSGTPKTATIGNLTFDQVKKIAKAKASDLSAHSMKAAVMTVTGTCVSVGVTIEGKTAKEFQAEVRQGLWDAKMNEPLREG